MTCLLSVFVFAFSILHVSVTSAQVPEVDICLVTVDTSSTHNIVVWEKPATLEIDSFLVYRMFDDSLYYEVGAVHYDSLSIFHDYDVDADPNTSAHRYKLSTLDTAGIESALSDYHATMHLTVTTAGDMLWSWYKIENSGNPVLNFNCYRDDLGDGNFSILSVIDGTEQTWTDDDIDLYPSGRYVIDVDWSISCSASRENVNTTRSNLDERTAPDPASVNQLLADQINIYPNPSQGQVWLNIPAEVGAKSYVLYSSMGAVSTQTSMNQYSSGGNLNLELPQLASGIYFLEIETDRGSLVKKVVMK